MEIELECGIWTRGVPLADGEGGFGKMYQVRAADGSSAVAKFVPKA
ncbi:hypothetical protein [Rhodococcus sp. NPDC076796]